MVVIYFLCCHLPLMPHYPQIALNCNKTQYTINIKFLYQLVSLKTIHLCGKFLTLLYLVFLKMDCYQSMKFHNNLIWILRQWPNSHQSVDSCMRSLWSVGRIHFLGSNELKGQNKVHLRPIFRQMWADLAQELNGGILGSYHLQNGAWNHLQWSLLNGWWHQYHRKR